MKGEQKKRDEFMSGALTLDRRVAQQEAWETKPKGKKEELRRSNGRSKSTFNFSPDVIDVIGNAPWGTHLCQFYRTKEDLFDILVPYFKAGLEKNEFCMWVTSEPVDEKEAREVMRGAVPGFDQYLKTGQIEMVSYREWYLKGGAFNLKRILNAWLDKLEGALAKGYDGMRVAGNTAWLEKKDWRKFADYEEEINSVIGNYRMIAMCTHSLDGCGPLELIDVVQNHQLALIRREGKWELTENSERKNAKKKIQEQIELLNVIKESLTHPFYIIDVNDYTVKLANSAARLGKLAKTSTCYALTHGEDSPCKGENPCPLSQVKRTKKPAVVEHIHYDKDGNERIVEIHGYPVFDSEGNVVQMIEYVLDVTERKKAERKIEVLSRFPSENPNPVLRLAINGRVLYANDAGRKVFKAEVGKKMPERYLPILKKAASSGRHVTFEEQVGGRYFSSEVRFIVKADYFNMDSKDITERKKSEQALLESESKYRSLFGNMLDGFAYCKILLDENNRPTDFVYLEINDAFERLTGLKKENVAGKKATEAIPGIKDSHPELFDIYGKVALTGKETKFDIYFEPLEIWLSISVYSPKKGYFVAVFDNITERKKVQIALESEKRHLEALFKSVPQGIVTAGLNHEVIDINPAFTEVFGYCLEEIKGKDVDEILAPKEKLHEARRITQEYDRGKISTVETYRTRQDGKLIPVEISGAPIIVDGKQIGVYTIYKDISERKKAQEKLQNLSEFRESVIENASVWLNVLDAKGNVVIWNKAAERISGYSRKEVLRHDKIWEWLYPDEEYRKEILETVSAVVEKGKVAEDSETRIRCKDGQTRMISWNSRNLLDEKGNPIGSVALGRDITDRRKAEAKVQRTLGKLRRALRATIQAMVMTVEMRDAYTAGHQRRVTDLASAIARGLHLSGDEIDGIRMAGSIHDIGKIGVPAEILNKPVRLADMEFELIKTHPAIGYNILKEIKFPWPVAKIVLQHHERIDGSGYPDGLSGDDILIEARILAVADVVEALASHRPYRPALGIDKALEEIREKRGTLYDQEVVDTCLKLFTEKRFKFKESKEME